MLQSFYHDIERKLLSKQLIITLTIVVYTQTLPGEIKNQQRYKLFLTFKSSGILKLDRHRQKKI